MAVAAKIIDRNFLNSLRPVVTLEVSPAYGYNKPYYNLYEIDGKFCMVEQCHNDKCGSMVSFEQKDLRDASCAGYGGFDYYGHEFTCPKCGRDNRFYPEVFANLLIKVSKKI